jgi:hypothetical protein
MNRRPKIQIKRISKAQVKGYEYVRPNPGVHAIASINGRGAYRKAQGSALSSMTGLSASQRKRRATVAVRNATRPGRTNQGKNMPRRRLRRNRKSAWAGTRKVTVRIPRSNAHESRYPVKDRRTRPVTFRVPSDAKRPISLLAANRRRKSTRRRKVALPALRRNRRRPVRRVMKRNVARRRPARRVKRRVMKRNVARRRPVRRVKRRSLKRNAKRRSMKRNVARRRPVRRVKRRALKRNVSRRRPVRALKRNVKRRSMKRNGSKSFLRKNAGAMDWLKTGGLITAGVVSHKLLTGLLKNLLSGGPATAAADPAVEAQTNGSAAASGLGFLPASVVPYAGIISGAISAAAGVYVTTRAVKDAQTRQLVAGGMVASFLHTVIVELLKKQSPKYAESISGLGSSNAYAARLSAMYGMGASIEPMYSQIGTGEYFSSGVGALPSYAAAAGTGEYFSSGVGEYFSSGLGEYGSNPDMMQAAAGYGALDAGGNTNHPDPTSDLDRELSIAEAAAGVGNVMQAAAGYGGYGGLGNVHSVQASQTWIPGESNPQIWAGVRPVDRSQMQTAMVPAGSLQSGGGQGIFG